MSTRIDKDRDVVIEPDKESLPSAIADRASKYTHAYPEGFRMDRGNIKIFGPQKAREPQRVLVIDNRTELAAAIARSQQQAAIALRAEAAVEDTEAEVRRSWADEDEDEETPQRVLVHVREG